MMFALQSAIVHLSVTQKTTTEKMISPVSNGLKNGRQLTFLTAKDKRGTTTRLSEY